jgi:hypothetical protein
MRPSSYFHAAAPHSERCGIVLSIEKSEVSRTATSVAGPGCLSRIQKQQQKREVKKKFVVLPFFASHITKLKII